MAHTKYLIAETSLVRTQLTANIYPRQYSGVGRSASHPVQKNRSRRRGGEGRGGERGEGRGGEERGGEGGGLYESCITEY